MKCSKCGAECNDKLVFCLECGSPLQVMTDFSLMEQELANSIGEFMDEMEQEESIDFDEFEDMKTIDVPVDEINMELKIVDINREVSKKSDIYEDDLLYEEEEEITPVYVPRKKKAKKKNNTKLYIIFGAVAVCVIAIVVALLVFMGKGDGDKEPEVKDFTYYYEEAEGDLNTSKLDKALDNALLALENAKNDEDIVKARLLIKLIYEAQNFTGELYMNNLEELFKRGQKNDENAAILLTYYAEKNNGEGILRMFDYVTETVARECLGKMFIDKPEVNLESGQYINVINIEINADKDSTIYYAVYKEGSDYEYVEYKGPVEINELGEFTLSTYSVNEDGMISYKNICNYTIVEGEMTGPAITPESGTYKEPTKITIAVPEGGKVYYTYDGTEPDEKATEYTEPVEMLKGVNTIKAVAIDKYGNKSEITSVLYNLKLSRNETVDSGKEKVWNHYLTSGIINAEGITADGSVLEISYHNAYEIGNGEYYVYQVVTTSADGTTTAGITYCGVNTYDGTVALGLIEGEEGFIIPESE